MSCPNCQERENISISSAEGFSKGISECNKCGCAWTITGEGVKIISEGRTFMDRVADKEIEDIKRRLADLEYRLRYIEVRGRSCR